MKQMEGLREAAREEGETEREGGGQIEQIMTDRCWGTPGPKQGDAAAVAPAGRTGRAAGKRGRVRKVRTSYPRAVVKGGAVTSSNDPLLLTRAQVLYIRGVSLWGSLEMTSLG